MTKLTPEEHWDNWKKFYLGLCTASIQSEKPIYIPSNNDYIYVSRANIQTSGCGCCGTVYDAISISGYIRTKYPIFKRFPFLKKWKVLPIDISISPKYILCKDYMDTDNCSTSYPLFKGHIHDDRLSVYHYFFDTDDFKPIFPSKKLN